MANPIDNLGDYGKITGIAKELGGVGPWLDQVGANAVEKAAPSLISKGRGEGVLITLTGLVVSYGGYKSFKWGKVKYDEYKVIKAEKLQQLEESDAILRQEISNVINQQIDDSAFTSNETKKEIIIDNEDATDGEKQY